MKEQKNIVAGPSKLVPEHTLSRNQSEEAVSDLIDRTREAFKALGQDMILLKTCSKSDWEASEGRTQGCMVGMGNWCAIHAARMLLEATNNDPALCLSTLIAVASSK